MRTQTTLLLALLATTGCAYHRDLRSAAAHAEDGEWREALADYESAQGRRPRSEKAAAGVEAVREHAVMEALADGARAVEAGRYEAAYEHVAWAQAEMPEVPEIQQGYRAIEAAMREALTADITAGRMDAGYDLALRTDKLFPRSRGLDAEIATIRDHFVRSADGHARKAQWNDALAALRVVYEHEPAQKSALADRDARFRGAWADEVVAQAKSKEKAKDAGGAAALYGRAWEIAGRDADRAAMRGHVDALRARGAWDVVVLAHGQHAMAFGEEVDQALARAAGVRPTTDRRYADLVIALEAGASRCEQNAVVRIADQPFVAGYRDVPNPTYDALMEELHRERGALQDLQDREAALERAIAHVQRSADVYEAEVFAPREAALQAALGRLASAEEAMTAQQAEVTRLTEELARLEANNGPLPARAAVTAKLDAARKRIEELRAVIEGAHPAVLAATAARDEARVEMDARTAAVGQAIRDHEAVLKPLADLSARVRGLEDRRQHTPATVQQEIVEVFRYEVADWTRTCHTDVEIGLSGAHGADVIRVSRAASVQDTSWGHFPQYGVIGDPLRFALSDAQLFAKADEAAIPGLIEAVNQRVAEDRSAEIATALALASTNPDGATSAMLSAWLAAPELVGGADRAAIERHLAGRYGLTALATLRD